MSQIEMTRLNKIIIFSTFTIFLNLFEKNLQKISLLNYNKRVMIPYLNINRLNTKNNIELLKLIQRYF